MRLCTSKDARISAPLTAASKDGKAALAELAPVVTQTSSCLSQKAGALKLLGALLPALRQAAAQQHQKEISGSIAARAADGTCV
jgi:hypothetical protein